jgi:glycosyltransferase involved in cell wall biosynthesis
MRILFTLWGPSVGGSETAVRTLCVSLSTSGHEASALSLTDSGQLSAFFAARNAKLTNMDLDRGSQILLARRQIADILSDLNPDLVVTDSFGYVGVVIRLAGYRGPLWGVEHGSLLVNRLRLGSRAKEYATRLCARYAYDGEVAVSDYMERVVVGYPHGRALRVIPNPARTPTRVPPFPKRLPLTIGFAGRLVPGKGVDRALELVAALRDRGLSVRFEIAGQGPDRARLEAITRDLKLSDQVDFRGWVEDIALHWGRCHVAVALNDRFVESFCVSIAEALAHGRPAIVTPYGALPSLLDGPDCGMVWSGSDVQDVETYLTDLLQPGRLETSSARAVQSAARFAPHKVADQFIDLAS